MIVMSPAWFPGITPQQCANILIKDSVLGDRALWLAKIYGDRMFEPIRIASNNYSDLNNRNSFWVADFILSDKSNSSLETSLELFSNKSNLYAKLVGAIGLAAKNDYPLPVDGSSFIVQVATNKSPHETGPPVYWKQYNWLAIIALGYTKQTAALPFLEQIVTGDHRDYWRDAYACEAIARIGEPKAIPILRQVFIDPNFYATPEAFTALITLNDKQAVPLAIARIKLDGAGANIFLIKALEKQTGQKYGYDYVGWEKWWSHYSITGQTNI
ncbi:MAG TPA: HEAT repeat domain-containing protein [Candidatus Acidoferrales bacterium]|nr:HEAT repeat domain-containing protein [Candidatus Acidoferrales bacterium]